MRPLFLLLPIFTWIQFGSAQESDVLSVVASLPQCAQLCLMTTMGNSSCELSDPRCMCQSAQFTGTAEACIRKSCTLKQVLTTKNTTATFCQEPIRDDSNKIRVTNILIGVVSIACTILRVTDKVSSVGFRELGWDDYAVVAATSLGIPLIVIIDRGVVVNGLAMDIWTVPFDHITNFARWLFILEIVYFLLVATVKLSLLFFLLRIFPKRMIRRLLWATIALDVVYGVSFVISAIFQCQPMSFFWTKWHRETIGKCIDVNALAWSNAINSNALDIWMLMLPLYEVFHLQLSWRSKISVAMMFFVGTFVTVVSALRLQSLIDFGASKNPTWDQADVIYWSCIEINVGIICSCMPSLRIILVRLFPRFFGSTQEVTKNYKKYGGRSPGMGGASAVRGGLNKGHNAKDPHTITYTQTFAVQYGDSDETSLVHMDEFVSKKEKPESSNTPDSDCAIMVA